MNQLCCVYLMVNEACKESSQRWLVCQYKNGYHVFGKSRDGWIRATFVYGQLWTVQVQNERGISYFRCTIGRSGARESAVMCFEKNSSYSYRANWCTCMATIRLWLIFWHIVNFCGGYTDREVGWIHWQNYGNYTDRIGVITLIELGWLH